LNFHGRHLVTIAQCSTNKEDGGTLKNNEVELSVPLEIKAQLSLTGRSAPEQLDYSVRNRSAGESSSFDSEIGPLVSHMHQVLRAHM
jgi:hypothetical protein